MKRPISPAYTFTPGLNTLNLSGIAGFNVANLFAVIDLATGALIYAPLAGFGYSALSGTTLTLQASMTGLNAADPLMIIYDDGGKPAEDASVQAVVTALAAILTKQPAAPALAANQATAILALQSIQALLAKGQQAGANSLPVVLSSDGPFATNFGLQTDAPSTSDSAAASLVALVKRSLARWTALLAVLPAALGRATSAASFPVVLASDQAAVLVTPGKPATAGDTAITAGGTAQTLFGGATPANGWKVANPDPAEDLWVSDSATAAPNGQGSTRIPAGGIVTTEPGERPVGPVSIYGASTGHLVTARSW